MVLGGECVDWLIRGGNNLKSRLLYCFVLFFSAHAVASIDLSMPEKEMGSYIDDRTPEQLGLLEKIVNINSGTANVEGVRAVGELIRPEFEALGFKVEWHELPKSMKHAGSLVATHTGASKVRLLLIGHLDTVFAKEGAFQRFEYTQQNRYAKGPGVIDDKGAVVTILYALKALKEIDALSDSNITVVLTGDEELSAKPAQVSRKALIDAAKHSYIALDFEFALAPDSLVIARRGLAEWTVTSTGQSRHSSTIFQPGVGFGAVFELSRILDAMQQRLSKVPGLTLNPGLLLGGQTVAEDVEEGAGNARGRKTQIASQALVHGDLRYVSNEQRESARQSMMQFVNESLPGTSSNLEFRDIVPIMAETASGHELLSQYSEISQGLGGAAMSAVPPVERGAADISYISEYVPATLGGLGPWGEGAHSENETLEIASLPIVTKCVAIFLYRKITEKQH
jgi:glutamate carboxypeptidase